MQKSVGKVQEDFTTLRTGRADPKMLDRIEVDYYGAKTPLNGIAGVTVADASTLVVQPYDLNALADIGAWSCRACIAMTHNDDHQAHHPPVVRVSRTRQCHCTHTAPRHASAVQLETCASPSTPSGGSAERAIMASDLGITPGNDGKVIRLAIPPLTAERRKELGKQAAKVRREEIGKQAQVR